MAEIATIEIAAKLYADEVKKLAVAMDNMESEIAAVRARYDGSIAALVGAVEASYEDVYRYIEESPAQFDKPKTLTFDNTVKVGYIKARDKYDYEDDELLAMRIANVLPSRHKALVKTKVSIVKEALKGLTEAELGLIGVQFTPGGDAPIVKLLLPDVEKFIERYLKSKD
jgi:phage host-nuclease inhibitor protein Gam